MSDPIHKSKRMGAALFTTIAVVSQVLGTEMDVQTIESIGADLNDLITTASGSVAVALALWSKIRDIWT